MLVFNHRAQRWETRARPVINKPEDPKPEVLKIYPEMIFRAINKNIPSGAFRVWFLAKDFDRGSGFIPAKAFRQYLSGLGIARPTYYRWLDQAINAGLLERQADVYRLVAWERGAIVAGITDPGDLMRMVRIPKQQFINRGWLAWVWRGYMKHFEGKEVTRGTLEKLTGVPERTQRIYHQKTSIKSIENYVDLGPQPQGLDARVADPRQGEYYSRGRMIRRVANTYQEIEGVTLANKGRTPTVKDRLRRCIYEGSSPQKRDHQRLYVRTRDQARQAIKQARRNEGDPETRAEFYYQYLKAARPKIQIWAGVAL